MADSGTQTSSVATTSTTTTSSDDFKAPAPEKPLTPAQLAALAKGREAKKQKRATAW